MSAGATNSSRIIPVPSIVPHQTTCCASTAIQPVISTACPTERIADPSSPAKNSDKGAPIVQLYDPSIHASPSSVRPTIRITTSIATRHAIVDTHIHAMTRGQRSRSKRTRPEAMATPKPRPGSHRVSSHASLPCWSSPPTGIAPSERATTTAHASATRARIDRQRNGGPGDVTPWLPSGARSARRAGRRRRAGRAA